jgi:hypothetical protein
MARVNACPSAVADFSGRRERVPFPCCGRPLRHGGTCAIRVLWWAFAAWVNAGPSGVVARGEVVLGSGKRKARTTADPSLHPSGYAPAFGRAVGPSARLFYDTRERVPFRCCGRPLRGTCALRVLCGLFMAGRTNVLPVLRQAFYGRRERVSFRCCNGFFKGWRERVSFSCVYL